MKWFLPFVCVLFCAVLIPYIALAETNIAIELSSNSVNISTGFTGSDVSVFGVKSGTGDVIIILEGPRKDNIVRRKHNILGAWINRSWVTFKNVLSYYDYAVNVTEDNKFMPQKLRREKAVGQEALISMPKYKQDDIKKLEMFQKALIRNKQAEGLYPQKPKDILFMPNGFFRANFHLPANVPRGDYKVRALLVRGGKIVSEISKPLQVQQIGLSANLNKFAQKNGFTYGLFCVCFALLIGWISNVFVRRNA